MKLKYSVLMLTVIISSNLLAQDVTLHGTIPHTLHEKTISVKGMKKAKITSPREIKLLKVNLSDHAKHVLTEKAMKSLSPANQLVRNNVATNKKLPTSMQLGMNGVPVLNQGSHGSCVTFAVTAAVDAALEKGDYVSQLCQLQLGNYLQNNGYTVSGWDGSLGRFVLSQMDVFGIVNKTEESTKGCGGLTAYPLNGVDPESSINIEDYHPMSESLDEQNIGWSPILDVYQAINRFDTNKTLEDVKTSLVQGDRVAFASLLLDFDLGFMGAVGTKNTTYDTWVLTTEIARDIALRPFFGAHEMLITGYDDDAIATDEDGRQHRGLLTLRNSWGKDSGDHGDFYMSYDYFKVLVLEADRIRKFVSDTDDEQNP